MFRAKKPALKKPPLKKPAPGELVASRNEFAGRNNAHHLQALRFPLTRHGPTAARFPPPAHRRCILKQVLKDTRRVQNALRSHSAYCILHFALHTYSRSSLFAYLALAQNVGNSYFFPLRNVIPYPPTRTREAPLKSFPAGLIIRGNKLAVSRFKSIAIPGAHMRGVGCSP